MTQLTQPMGVGCIKCKGSIRHVVEDKLVKVRKTVLCTRKPKDVAAKWYGDREVSTISYDINELRVKTDTTHPTLPYM